MNGNQFIRRTRLLVSYLWASGEEKDLKFVFNPLKDLNIDVKYESLRLVPEIRLWQQVEQRLTISEFDGWLYVLTHQIVTRGACVEELLEAIDKTQQHRGDDFPMIGLLYGAAAQQVPASLRMRPCVSVGDPDWKRRLAHLFSRRAPSEAKTVVRESARFLWKVHHCYGGESEVTAIEVSPKLESIPYWRFAIPKTAHPARWGVGGAGGQEISPIKFAVAKGSARYGSSEVNWFGAANGVSNSESAYIAFFGPLPDFICFGPAQSPNGPPGPMEVFMSGNGGVSDPHHSE